MGLLNWFGLGQALNRQAMANITQDDGEFYPQYSREEAMKRRKARKARKAQKQARRANRGRR